MLVLQNPELTEKCLLIRAKKCYQIKRFISNNTFSRAKNVTIQDEKTSKQKNERKLSVEFKG